MMYIFENQLAEVRLLPTGHYAYNLVNSPEEHVIDASFFNSNFVLVDINLNRETVAKKLQKMSHLVNTAASTELLEKWRTKITNWKIYLESAKMLENPEMEAIVLSQINAEINTMSKQTIAQIIK